MDTDIEIEQRGAVKPLGPEDIRRGQYVSVHRRVGEVYWLPFFCESEFKEPSVKVLRYGYTPKQSGLPLRVKAVCLPFVLVTSPQGRVLTLDTRSMDLVELSADYGKAAFKALREDHKKRHPTPAVS